MQLTIGIATHNDFDGLYMTVQPLRLFNYLEGVELVVIDQSPDTAHGEETRKLLNFSNGFQNIKYVPFPKPLGTSPGRQKIFEVATSEFILVLDSHVMITQDSIESMYNYLQDNPKDIVSGPILWDNVVDRDHEGFNAMATHYAGHWREQMWGTWSMAYGCPCGQFRFAIWPEGDLCRYETLDIDPKPVTQCPHCGKRMPLVPYSDYANGLKAAGYREQHGPDLEPYEVPGQGLGMFMTRKDAWPNFCELSCGFGGEELWIHQRYRDRGGRAMCIPDAYWLHKFPRVNKPSYPNHIWYKCRNYVVEFQQLEREYAAAGRELPSHLRLDVVKQHFVNDLKVMPLDQWELMVSDPVRYTHGPGDDFVTPTVIDGKMVGARKPRISEIYDLFCKTPRDLHVHLPVLREFAGRVQHITEFTKRREPMAAWLSTDTKKTIVSHCQEADDTQHQLLRALGAEAGNTISSDKKPSNSVNTIEFTDLLFLDTVHHADWLRTELNNFAVSVGSYIIIRGTGAFGDTAEGGGAGMWETIRDFARANQDEWRCVYHNSNLYGITVFSRLAEDWPATPLTPWPKGEGPGSELMIILKYLGFQATPTCGCTRLAKEMDDLGSKGCREQKASLVKRIEENAEKWGWKRLFAKAKSEIEANDAVDDSGIVKQTFWQKLAVVGRALTSGIFLKVNWLDPVPGLVDEAIGRAEARGL